MIKSYTDPTTKCVIEFSKNTTLAIYLKKKSAPRILYKTFPSSSAEKAFKEFYDLNIPKGVTKYLYQEHLLGHEIDRHKIIHINGFLEQEETENLTRGNIDYAYKRDFRVDHLPLSLIADLLQSCVNDITDLKVTKNKLIQLIIAYYLSLPLDEKNKVLAKGLFEARRYQAKDGGKANSIKGP